MHKLNVKENPNECKAKAFLVRDFKDTNYKVMKMQNPLSFLY